MYIPINYRAGYNYNFDLTKDEFNKILETLMNRKPKTELEIIDECDEFLDSFTNQERISLNRLSFALGSTFPETTEIKKY